MKSSWWYHRCCSWCWWSCNCCKRERLCCMRFSCNRTTLYLHIWFCFFHFHVPWISVSRLFCCFSWTCCRFAVMMMFFFLTFWFKSFFFSSSREPYIVHMIIALELDFLVQALINSRCSQKLVLKFPIIMKSWSHVPILSDLFHQSFHLENQCSRICCSCNSPHSCKAFL